jgi:hypothetical protein
MGPTTVTIRSWVKSRWAGKSGELRARLDPKHVLVDFEEPRLKASERFHIREVKGIDKPCS